MQLSIQQFFKVILVDFEIHSQLKHYQIIRLPSQIDENKNKKGNIINLPFNMNLTRIANSLS